MASTLHHWDGPSAAVLHPVPPRLSANCLLSDGRGCQLASVMRVCAAARYVELRSMDLGAAIRSNHSLQTGVRSFEKMYLY